MSVAPSSVEAAARWRLLSLGFTAPTAEIIDELETLAEALRDRGDGEIDSLLEALQETSVVALASQHHALFGGLVRLSPYEGGYEADPTRQGRQIADVAAFYRAFGATAHGPASERPDHVGCELEFLAFLELAHAASLESGDAPTALMDEIAATFLRDHAGRWLPTFFAEVYEASDERGVYGALAALGSRWVGEELERRSVECAPPTGRRRRVPVEGDSFACM